MSQAARIVAVQAFLGGLCSLVFFVVGPQQGLSAVAAVGASVIPAGYYAWLQQRTFNAARLVAHGVLKTVFTMTLVALSIVVLEVHPLGFFVTLGVMQLGYLAPRERAREREQEKVGNKKR